MSIKFYAVDSRLVLCIRRFCLPETREKANKQDELVLQFGFHDEKYLQNINLRKTMQDREYSKPKEVEQGGVLESFLS